MPPARGATEERGAGELGTAEELKNVPLVEDDAVSAVLRGSRVFFQEGGAEVGDEECVVFLDTETTGLDPTACKVLELALLKVWYSPSQRRPVFIDGAYDQLEDPQEQISNFITGLTGISNERFSGPNAGLKFDREAAQVFVSEGSCRGRKPLLIAHNARFDKRFCDKYFPEWSCDADWACSCNGIRWPPGPKKQEHLLKARGYCFVGHRAINDVLALAWLMHLEPERFMEMLESGRLERSPGPRAEPARASIGRPVEESPPESGHGVVSFGKHRGKAYEQVVAEDPGYVAWVLARQASSRGMQEFQAFLRGLVAAPAASATA